MDPRELPSSPELSRPPLPPACLPAPAAAAPCFFPQPSLFSASDGPGHSLVFYFALPEGWEPSQVDNRAALAMVQRLVHNGTEFDG